MEGAGWDLRQKRLSECQQAVAIKNRGCVRVHCDVPCAVSNDFLRVNVTGLCLYFYLHS